MSAIDAQWRAIRRLLVVRLDNLGDVLVTTPAIHAIAASLPQVEITLLTSPVGAQAGQLNPDITDVMAYEAPWVDPWCRLPHDSGREQRVIDEIRDRRFNAAVVFTSFRQSPLPASYLCYLADVPLRLAASADAPGSLLTTRHQHSQRRMHEVERALDLVAAVGLTTGEVDLVLHVPKDARNRVMGWMSGETEWGGEQFRPGSTRRRFPAQEPSTSAPISRPLVIVHPGCSMPARTYPWQLFAEVIDGLVERLNATVFLTGSGDERGLTEQILNRLHPAARAVTRSVAGELRFPDFCALIEAADLVVTNNTGPMHLAAAVKTPVVALFALTNPPEQWGPWRVSHRLLFHEVPCRLCYSRVCPFEHECLHLVSPASVVDAAADLLPTMRCSQGAPSERLGDGDRDESVSPVAPAAKVVQ